MKFNAGLLVALFSFFLLLTFCGMLHLHGWRGFGVSALGSGLFVMLSRRWWLKLTEPYKRPPNAKLPPAQGTRAQRRAQEKRRRSH